MAPRGASYERAERDLYPTPAWVTEALLAKMRFSNVIWEPACGNGQMSQVLATTGATVYRSDIHPIGDAEARPMDFLTEPCPWPITADIITNPPYGKQCRTADAFIRRSFEHCRKSGRKIAMLLPVDYDSAATRAWAFADCTAFWGKIVLTKRIKWFEMPGVDGNPSANHAWFIWDWSAGQVPRLLYGP